MIKEWNAVAPGDVLLIGGAACLPYKLLVESWRPGAAKDIAIITGDRLTLSGRPSRKVTRREWAVCLAEVIEIRRPQGQ